MLTLAVQNCQNHFIQTRDDNIPEQKQIYTLEITSATGGATVNSAAKTAQIFVVASDYPHGLFEFEYPSEVTVQEDSTQVRNEDNFDCCIGNIAKKTGEHNCEN